MSAQGQLVSPHQYASVLILPYGYIDQLSPSFWKKKKKVMIDPRQLRETKGQCKLSIMFHLMHTQLDMHFNTGMHLNCFFPVSCI